MEEPRTCLLAARRELTQILCNILQRYIYQGLNYYWQQSKTSARPGHAYEMFQKKLELIPQWNQETVEAEFARICDKSRCNYLDDLIRKVFVYNTQILTAADNVQNRNIRVKVPRGDRFVHRCYITCARAFWESAWLLDDREEFINKMEQARNLHRSYKLICTSIENTIREMLPIEDIVSRQFEPEAVPEEPQITQVARIDDLFRNTVQQPTSPPPTITPFSSMPTGMSSGIPTGMPTGTLIPPPDRPQEDDIESRIGSLFGSQKAPTVVSREESRYDSRDDSRDDKVEDDNKSDKGSDVSQPLSFADALEKVIYLGPSKGNDSGSGTAPQQAKDEGTHQTLESEGSDKASLTQEAEALMASFEPPKLDYSIDLPRQEVPFELADKTDDDDKKSIISPSEFNFFDDTRTVM